MARTKLDTLPAELLAYICETIYYSHKSSLRSLTLVNRKYSAVASEVLFRDICFSWSNLSEGYVKDDCEAWTTLLTRRDCLQSVRYMHLHGCFWPHVPFRFLHSRQRVLKETEWQQQTVEDFYAHEGAIEEWEEDIFFPLSDLIGRLPHLETLHWAAIEQVPECISSILCRLRQGFRLEMPEWRLRFLAREELSSAQNALITTPYLRSIAARVVAGDMNKDVLLYMLSGANPSLEAARIVVCEQLTTGDVDPSAEVRRIRLQEIYDRNEQKAKARLTTFSLHGKEPIEKTELDQWFAAANMSAIQRLELRSGVEDVEVWKTTLQPRTLPHLREVLLGFKFDCSREEHDAATEWIRKLPTLQELELRGNISPTLVDVVFKVHGATLRKLALVPEAHNSLFSLKFLPRDLEKLNTACPLLEELTIPIKRGIAVGNRFHEAQNYATFGNFAKLTHLHICLDNARWGEMADDWILANSDDREYETQEYDILDTRRISYGHIRYAFINAATDENLARQIWSLITTNKIGLPLHELYIQPYGSMELLRGFRPDDRPELASHLVDLYAILSEISRPCKLSRHVRDDVDEVVVRGPPDAVPHSYWSGLEEEERNREEVVCHLEGKEMQIFRRIWGRKEGSLCWRDDWRSAELLMPSEGGREVANSM